MPDWAAPAFMADPWLRLPRSRRIRARGDFARIRSQGRRLSRPHLILNWHCLPEDRPSRLAVVTSRRVGSAVVRNRVRRLLRENFRLHQQELAKPVDLVIIAKPSMATHDFAQTKSDFLGALKGAGLLKGAA